MLSLKLLKVAPSWFRVLPSTSSESTAEKKALKANVVLSNGVRFISESELAALRKDLPGSRRLEQEILRAEDIDYSRYAMLTKTEFGVYLLAEAEKALSDSPHLKVEVGYGFVSSEFSLSAVFVTPGKWTGDIRTSEPPIRKVRATYNLEKFQGRMFFTVEEKEAFMKGELDSFLNRALNEREEDE